MSAEQTRQVAKSKYRPEIDGLRAFAVVAVIINHFNKAILPGGYLGVDIFFVISGYVITSSLYGRSSKDFKDFISGFYERRIKRLVPALSVFVLITSIALCLFSPSPGQYLRTGLTSLFGLSNLYLLQQSTDYFSQSTELNVFTHTWSLGVEEQFYILFPFLIWFSGFGRQTKNGARNLFLAVAILTIISLIGFLYLYPTNQPAAYFLMPTRFWEMAAGCLVFLGFQKRASIEQFLEQIPPFPVLALIIGVMYLPMAWAAPSTVAVVLLSSVLIASLKKDTAAFRFFTNSKVVYVGLISYSLYLWHWGVLSISRWTIGIHWWLAPVQIACMLSLAVASYTWIETPLRKGDWFGRRWKTFLVGGGFLAIASGNVVALAKPLNGAIFTGSPEVPDRFEDVYREKGYARKSCSIFQDTHNAILLSNMCGNFLDKNKPTIYVLGDSHASLLGDALSTFSAERKSFNVASVWGNYCKFPSAVHSNYDHPDLNGKSCFHLQEQVAKNLLEKVKAGDAVVIASFSIDQFVQTEENPFHNKETVFKSPSGATVSSGNAQRLYFDRVGELSRKLTSRGVKTFFYVNAGRYLQGNGDECFADWRTQWYRPFTNSEKRCLYPREVQYTKYRMQFKEDLDTWIKENGADTLLDAFDTVACDSKFCDGAFFVDNQHLRGWGFAFLADSVLRKIGLSS